MKKFITNKYVDILLGVLAFFGIWFIISYSIPYSTMIFPSPVKTIGAMLQLFGQKFTYKCIYATFRRMIIGFAIAFVSSLIFGTAAGNSQCFRYFLSPFISVMKSVPTACLVFLFLVIVGYNNAPTALVILISFPILYEAVSNGIENIDSFVTKASLIDCPSFIKRIIRIQMPSVRSYIIVGIASSFSLSFKIEIMAEILTGSTKAGLGCAILSEQRSNPTDMTQIFAYSLIAVLFVFAVSILFSFIKTKTSRN